MNVETTNFNLDMVDFIHCSDLYDQLNKSYQSIVTASRKHKKRHRSIKDDDIKPIKKHLCDNFSFHELTFQSFLQKPNEDFFSTVLSMQSEASKIEESNHLFSSQNKDFLFHRKNLQDIISLSIASKEPIVITEAYSPFRIIHVNKDWEDLCGYTKEEVESRSLRFIQGALTDSKKLFDLHESLKEFRSHHTIIINYKKNGVAFVNGLSVSPLYDTENQIYGFIGTFSDHGSVLIGN